MRANFHDDGHFTASFDPALGYLSVKRSSLPFERPEEARTSVIALLQAIDARRIDGVPVLVDSREAPGRNDPAFEAVAEELMRAMRRRFPKGAIVLSSVVGRMQVGRIQTAVGASAPYGVFTSEQDAVASLRRGR